MTRALLITLLALSFTVQCSEKSKRDMASATDSVAHSTIDLSPDIPDTLDQLSLPITLTPNSWNDLYSSHIKKYGPRQGAETTDNPYAKLIYTDTYAAIIFITSDETGSPVIVTLDKAGNQISQLDLLGSWASNSPEIWTTEVTTIDKDLSINLTDSVWTYSVDSTGNRIEESFKLTVVNEMYKIFNSGKIQKVK